MLSTIESRFATLRALIDGLEVSTKDSERLWFTSRIANTICDLRNIYKLNIITPRRKTDTGKTHGVYVLVDRHNSRTVELLGEFRDEVIAKYRFEPRLLKLYLGADFDSSEVA